MTDDARDVQAALAARSDPAAPPPSPSARQARHQAFARIYDRHAPVVRAVCARLSPVASDADDALQETFIRAYRLLHEVRDPDGVRSWLYAIARHVCAERRRARARRGVHEHAAGEERVMLNGTASVSASPRGDAPSYPVEQAEALDRLTIALDELPDEERLAIHLYYLENDPVAAAGSALGLSRSGFYKLLARAKAHLGTLMGVVNP